VAFRKKEVDVARPNELSATEAARLLGEGTLTCAALVRTCLERIDRREREVGAWVWLEPDVALARAREIDNAGRPGPLHGLPVGIKDIMATADMPTAYNSPIYADHRPREDADCVRRLKAAGGLALGKTVTTEFAVRAPGRTANPHDSNRTPGGSSSGSAAAVADRMVPLAFGTQTSGSISRPASFCGVVGYKPSFGRHDLVGIKAVAPSLDTLGFFGRSVGDVALVATALLAENLPDLASFESRPPVIGLCRTPWWSEVEAGTATAIEVAALEAARAGAQVSEVSLPEHFEDVVGVHRAIMDFEAARELETEHRDHRDQLSPELLEILDRGAAASPQTYPGLIERARNWRRQFGEFVGTFDVLLAPSVKGKAPEGLAATGDPLFTRVWTLLGAPTVTVPAATGPAGMPVGIEVVGSREGDGRTLAAAAWLELAIASRWPVGA
jgi:Asp-tRNA(Asn)/Glu-tRNA(Gln) amidotransferase A subunit family amidase